MKRRRCGQCSGCKAEECKQCIHCKDKPKYGGPGKKKQVCVKRVCKHLVNQRRKLITPKKSRRPVAPQQGKEKNKPKGSRHLTQRPPVAPQQGKKRNSLKDSRHQHTPPVAPQQDYRPYLIEAAKSGFVKSKITSIGIFGASGAGKTSLLRLLKGDDFVKEHNSTPVARTLKGIWLVSLGDNKWEKGSPNTLHRAIANSIKRTMKKDEGSSSTGCKGTYGEPPQTKKGKMETNSSLLTSSSSSPAASSQSVLDLPATKLVETFLESGPQDQTIEGFHFLNVTDSGGQAPFIDISPSLFPYNLLNLVVFKLTEPLKSEITFIYSKQGKLVSSEKRKITTEQLITAIFSSKSKIHKPELEGLEYSESFEKPQFMTFGTYFDEYNNNMEKLEEKNKILKDNLKDFEENLIPNNGDDIIFPLNTLSRDKETQEMARYIRELASSYYAEVEVPIRWYLFQIAIEELKQKNQTVIPFSIFSDIGKKHNMNEKDTKKALSYFHDLNICLYYPEILPQVVFTSPQYLFEKISEIVAVSLGEEQEKIRFDLKTQNQLIKEGIFTKSLLAKLRIEFLDDPFSALNFLELMHHLHIITPLPSHNTPHPVSSTSLPAPPKSPLPILYFMPSLLTPIDDPIPIHPDNIEPLLLTWDNTVPNGLFVFLISWLIHPSRLQLKRYEDDEEQHLLQQYRNKITLVCCKDVAYEIIMFECPAFIGLQLRNTCEHNQKDVIERSLAVFKMVLEGIQSIVNDRKWHSTVANPEKGYLCKIHKCKLKRPHMCYLNEEGKYVACRGHRMDVTDAHMVWFKRADKRIRRKRKRTHSDMNEVGGTAKKSCNDKEQGSRNNMGNRGKNKSSDKRIRRKRKRTHSDMNEVGGTAKKSCNDKEQGSRNNMGNRGKNKSSGSILNNIPSLSDAFKLLKKKSADWDAIGRAIDCVSGNDTRNERTGLRSNMTLSDYARLEEILNRWLQQGGTSSTWGQLIEALKEDYNDVVIKIGKFLVPPLSKAIEPIVISD